MQKEILQQRTCYMKMRITVMLRFTASKHLKR